MDKSKKNPLVSVIVNCFNGEEFLYQSIKSILNQTYKKTEIIFFDNNSTDNSLKIIKKFNNKKIKIFKNSTKKTFKLYKARNKAIDKAKGDFISFLDTDDTWNKNKLSSQISAFKKNPSINIFYSNYNLFFQNKKKTKKKSNTILPSGFILQHLLNDYCIGINTLLINKKIFKKFRFDENYNIIGDFDLLIKISSKHKIVALQKPLANYRVHKNNFSKNIQMYLSELVRWKEKNKIKLVKKKFNLNKINFYILKLQIKYILFKIFNIKL